MKEASKYVQTKLTFLTKRLCRLTWVSLAEHFDGGGHFLLTDSFILLPLGGGLESLPGQRAQVKVHEDIAEGLQVISSRLLCGGHKG